MQLELKAIQQEVGITFIYVTHDQEEALTMSDRLAVFNARPDRAARARRRTSTSARRRASWPGFVGTSNLLRGDVAEAVVGATGHVHGPPGEDPARRARGGRRCRRDRSALGRIREVVYLGPDTRYIVALDAGAELVVTQQNLATSSTEALAQAGQGVRLIWKRQHGSAGRRTEGR